MHKNIMNAFTAKLAAALTATLISTKVGFIIIDLSSLFIDRRTSTRNLLQAKDFVLYVKF